MKNIIFSLFLLIISINALAQSKDYIVYESKNMLLVKKIKHNKYKLTYKKTKDSYDNLIFVKRINRYFQVLDGNNNIFYIGEDWKKKDKVSDYFGVCGTVPHYTLSIKKTKSSFDIFEDETFYDHNNEMPAEKKYQISTQEVDSVLFINGKNVFEFTSNFDVGIGSTDPRMLLFVKNGYYYSKDNPELKYDEIDFTNYYHSLKTKKNNLYGLLGILEPKYTSIEKFDYYLAKAVKENGDVVFIDIEGNEYQSVPNKK